MAISPKLFKKMSKFIVGKMTAGPYDVRLAQNAEEVAAAQQLRYEVLFKESGGLVTKEMLNSQREEDEWDDVAFHVVVVDTRDANVVGTIRLVSKQELAEGQSFYTEHAFKLDPLLTAYPKALELSRACVSSKGRGGAILMLLWKFTMNFIEQNEFDLLFGCASFKGQDYAEHTEILSYLYERHLAAPKLMPAPRDTMQSVSIQEFKQKVKSGKERGKVPTLLKGYLKIGAKISDHAII
ncbi:MAG: GNAT family N-acyltransferase, partial [Pseudomonadota bacterium]